MAGELGFDTGPYVNVATFCDSVVQDKDNVLTLVRLIDQINVQIQGPNAPDELPPGAVVQTTFVLTLKPGQAKGGQKIRVDIEHPDTTTRTVDERSVNFSAGPTSGANLILKIGMQLSSTGLYWANAYVNDRLVSRTPLQINYSFTRGLGIGPQTL